MSTISTLSEFLLQAGTEYRIYDIGRGIRSLSSQLFLDIENNTIPYPYPRQNHAWLGILFWNKNLSHEQYIWFLKLPVDEVSHLILGPRDHFLQLVIETLSDTKSHQSDTLSKVENPYNFTPSQQMLADFNAITKAELTLTPSVYYRTIRQYLLAPQVVNWQTLALQGVSDYCAHLYDSNNTELLLQSLKALPIPVKNAFLASLEHYLLPIELVQLLIEIAKENDGDTHLQAMILRSLTQSQQYDAVEHYVLTTLEKSEASDVNLLSVIVGRHWQLLKTEEAVTILLEHAISIKPDVCIGFYLDLVGLPDMRTMMLSVLQKTDKNDVLRLCFEKMRKELNI